MSYYGGGGDYRAELSAPYKTFPSDVASHYPRQPQPYPSPWHQMQSTSGPGPESDCWRSEHSNFDSGPEGDFHRRYEGDQFPYEERDRRSFDRPPERSRGRGRGGRGRGGRFPTSHRGSRDLGSRREDRDSRRERGERSPRRERRSHRSKSRSPRRSSSHREKDKESRDKSKENENGEKEAERESEPKTAEEEGQIEAEDTSKNTEERTATPEKDELLEQDSNGDETAKTESEGANQNETSQSIQPAETPGIKILNKASFEQVHLFARPKRVPGDSWDQGPPPGRFPPRDDYDPRPPRSLNWAKQYYLEIAEKKRSSGYAPAPPRLPPMQTTARQSERLEQFVKERGADVDTQDYLETLSNVDERETWRKILEMVDDSRGRDPPQAARGGPPPMGRGDRDSRGIYAERDPRAGLLDREPRGAYPPDRDMRGGFPDRDPRGAYADRDLRGGFPERDPRAGFPEHDPRAGFPERDPRGASVGYPDPGPPPLDDNVGADGKFGFFRAELPSIEPKVVTSAMLKHWRAVEVSGGPAPARPGLLGGPPPDRMDREMGGPIDFGPPGGRMDDRRDMDRRGPYPGEDPYGPPRPPFDDRRDDYRRDDRPGPPPYGRGHEPPRGADPRDMMYPPERHPSDRYPPREEFDRRPYDGFPGGPPGYPDRGPPPRGPAPYDDRDRYGPRDPYPPPPGRFPDEPYGGGRLWPGDDRREPPRRNGPWDR